jgi:hypothetical protein
MLRAQIRFIHLEAKLHDDGFFERLVASGRYLKFLAVLDHASDLSASTWAAAHREILGEAGRQRGREPPAAMLDRRSLAVWPG